jgi:predicted DNA-binding transcriptional regulator AlpA
MSVVPTADQVRNTESRVFVRFADLKRMGIVQNWTTLSRWIAKGSFPQGRYLGANSRVWLVEEIDAWIASRPTTKDGAHGG